VLIQLRLGLIGGVWDFGGVGVLCELEGKGFVGLGGGLKLPLLKGVFQVKGRVF